MAVGDGLLCGISRVTELTESCSLLLEDLEKLGGLAMLLRNHVGREDRKSP